MSMNPDALNDGFRGHTNRDTAPEALRAQYEIYRRMPAGRRLELVFDLCDMGQCLAMAGLRRRHPEATRERLWELWAKDHLGPELFEQVYGASNRD